jgi:hypothetical protein
MSSTTSYSLSVARILIAAALCSAAASSAAPTITLQQGTLTIDGIAAGAEAVLLSVSRLQQGWSTVVVPKWQILVDEDADGTITYAAETGVPAQSLWIAVDATTGELAAAWPSDAVVTERTIDLATALTAGATGTLSLFEMPLKDVVLALVRPGGGAWQAQGSDGGATDYGAPDDAAVTTELTLATPLGESPAFDGVEPGDVLVGIGPKTLEFFAVQIVEEGE